MVDSLKVCFSEPAHEGAEVYNTKAPEVENIAPPIQEVGVNQPAANDGIYAENSVTDSAEVAGMNLQSQPAVGGLLSDCMGAMTKLAHDCEEVMGGFQQQPEPVVAQVEPEPVQKVYQQDYTMSAPSPGMSGTGFA